MVSSNADRNEIGASTCEAHRSLSFSARIGPATDRSLVIRRSARSIVTARSKSAYVCGHGLHHEAHDFLRSPALVHRRANERFIVRTQIRRGRMERQAGGEHSTAVIFGCDDCRRDGRRAWSARPSAITGMEVAERSERGENDPHRQSTG